MTQNYRKPGGIPGELARVEAISQVRPAAHVPQRAGVLNTAAAQLTRRGMMAAKAELANAALLELVKLLYEQDTDGRLANLDRGSRIIVPLPWGRVGCQKWGLRASEGRALRYIMLQRSTGKTPPPLLDYDQGARHWYVCWTNYPAQRWALAYLEQHPVTADEWRQAWRATRSAWAAKNMGSE